MSSDGLLCNRLGPNLCSKDACVSSNRIPEMPLPPKCGVCKKTQKKSQTSQILGQNKSCLVHKFLCVADLCFNRLFLITAYCSNVKGKDKKVTSDWDETRISFRKCVWRGDILWSNLQNHTIQSLLDSMMCFS